MDKKKKNILLVIIGVFIVALVLTLYFVIKAQNNPYIKEAIPQESLGLERRAIVLSNTEIESSDGVLYTVSSSVVLDKVEAFVLSLDSKLKQTEIIEGSYYEWMNGDNYVIYDLGDNSLTFGIKEGMVWNEADITNYSFAQFVERYFDKLWEYTISASKKMAGGETVYFANRGLGDYKIEMISDYQSTDYLTMKNGKIVYGKFLLTEFIEETKKAPLIDSSNLSKYINATGYPKEIHPDFGSVRNTILSEIDYKDDEFETVIDTLTNCKSASASIVYLFKSLTQDYLTPVYKLDLQCEITYKDTMYTIPAVGYVNAIDPKYVSTSE